VQDRRETIFALTGEPLMFTLGTAAKAAGVSKSTIHRAIKSGRMSARAKDGSGYQIDPAELFRVFPVPASQTAERHSGYLAPGTTERCATPPEAALSPLQTHLVRLEAELRASKELAETEQKLLDQLLTSERQRAEEFRKRADELRSERDRWAGVAESSQRQLTYIAEKPKQTGWWPFRRSAAATSSSKPAKREARSAAPAEAPSALGSALPAGFMLKDSPLL
jgi:hypothetical protein